MNARPLLVGLLAAAACICIGHGDAVAAAASASVTNPPLLVAEGTAWVLQLPEGARLSSPDLVGAELRQDDATTLRLDAARLLGADGGYRWWAHDLSVRGEGGWQPLCRPHSDGTSYAIVLPGRETPDGALVVDPASFALSCTSGALAKCLRMGYQPWQGDATARPRSDAADADARATFNACVRMVRADYTGRGLATTENGRQIDVYDDRGIQRPDMLPTQAFEAGWDEQGAVCVHHVRVVRNSSLAALQAATPRLQGQVGAVCDEAHARRLGARVFNRSTPTAPGAQK